MLDCFAKVQHEPTEMQLLATAHTVDTTSHWKILYAYLDSLSEKNIAVYMPFPRPDDKASSTGTSNSAAGGDSNTFAAANGL